MGLVYIGALRYLRQEGLDKNIKDVAGTSAGALFAAAFVLDIPMDEIERWFKSILSDSKLTSFVIDDFMSVLNNLGVDDGLRFVSIVAKYAQHMTFLDVTKKTGKNLIICATHVGTMTPVYFSVDKTPNVLVVDALRASMAIPWFVMPVKIGEDLYVDGGITDGVPLAAFPKAVPKERILILHLRKGAACSSSSKSALSSPMNYLMTMTETYISGWLVTSLLSRLYPYYLGFDNIPVSFFPGEWVDGKIVINITEADIDGCFVIGYEQMQEKVTEWECTSKTP